MHVLIAFVSGVIFAGGLVIGGMTQPAKVVGFLDVFGQWDPSLAFVMGGALLVNLLAYKFIVPSRPKPLVEESFHIPTRSDIDWRLVTGGVFFGAGWGIAGFCPGPALTALGSGKTEVMIFVASMAGGMYLYRLVDDIVFGEVGDTTEAGPPERVTIDA
jgi:hypothetical protein